jgi:hypothetical protein
MTREKEQEKKRKRGKTLARTGTVRFEYGCWAGDGGAHLGAGRG